MVEDPVIAEEEWAKEGDLELRVARARNDLRLPLRGADTSLGAALVAGVQHPDHAIRSHRILGHHAFAVSLETAVVARDLIPPAQIAGEVHRFGGLRHTRIADWTGPGAARNERSDSDYDPADYQNIARRERTMRAETGAI
jgi:hypothetical protein